MSKLRCANLLGLFQESGMMTDANIPNYVRIGFMELFSDMRSRQPEDLMK